MRHKMRKFYETKRKMRVNQNRLKQLAWYVPLTIACVAMVYLGTMFLQGYNSGNAWAHATEETHAVGVPSEEPLVGTIEIADASNLPSNLPAVPSPAKQSVTHTMIHKESSRPQPARPQQNPSETATQVQDALNNVAHNVIEKPKDPPVVDIPPVPEVPAPTLAPITQ
jgi:hypothetical protein